jgi:cell division transport system permease protein
MNSLVQWFRAYLAAVLHLLREPVASLFNLLALASAFGLGLTAVVWLGEASLGRASVGERLWPQITLVLRSSTDDAARSRLQRDLKSTDGIRAVRFISRDDALKRLSRGLGDEHLLEGLGSNPLPDVIAVNLASDLPAPRVDALLKSWRGRNEVEQVLADREGVERLRRVGSAARLMAQAVVALLLASGAVVVFNTIRLQLTSRQQEVELFHLLGATASFVRRPFVARGTLLALAGGAVGWGLAEVLVRLVAAWVGPLAAAWGFDTPPAAVPVQSGLTFLGITVLIGWFAAWLGVSRHLIATDRR